MFRKTVPDDRSGNANFVCGIPLLFLAQPREVRYRYADVLEICRAGTSDTVKCKECNLQLYSLRDRQPV